MNDKPKTLYFALLNHGTMRTSFVTDVLPSMRKTPGVELHWEHPAKTWDHPISSNRNRIVQRFLQTDYDFLLMVDDDVVPLHNPAELVYANADIIGCPALVRQNRSNINWVAYVKHPTEDGYGPVDFAGIDDDVDLLKVDIVGTGCIIIARRVLEHPDMKAAFNCEYNEDGITTSGTDFAFCRRAKRAGFEIYATPKRVCEHYKEVGLLEMDGYLRTEGVDPAPVKYGIPYGTMAITQKDWHFIRDIIHRNKVSSVLEFGAGLSSLLISEIASVQTYETDQKCLDNILSLKNGNQLSVEWWDGTDTKIESGFDLAFVDGPLGRINGGPGREHSIRLASEYANCVIVHDAGRDDETKWQEKYLRPKFKLKAQSGHHRTRCNFWVKQETV